MFYRRNVGNLISRTLHYLRLEEQYKSSWKSQLITLHIIRGELFISDIITMDVVGPTGATGGTGATGTTVTTTNMSANNTAGANTNFAVSQTGTYMLSYRVSATVTLLLTAGITVNETLSQRLY